MLIMGACGLAYEYTLSKIASDLLGNSIRQWALIIGFMMFFMGIGADVQKYIKNQNLFEKFLIAEAILGIIGSFSPLLLIYSFGLWNSHYILIQYIIISAIGLLIGFEIPLLIRVNEIYTKELKLNIGNILKMDYIGSLIGAILWVFYLPQWFHFSRISFIVGLLNIVSALGAFYFLKHIVVNKKTLLSILSIFLLFILSGLIYSEKWMIHGEQYLYRDKVIYSETTPYQHIILTSNNHSISCYINGCLQFNSLDEHIYHELLVHPVMSLAECKENILVLGGGDGLAVRELLKYPSIKQIDLCDIDPNMTSIALNNPHINELNQKSLNSAKLKIINNNSLIPTNKEEIFLPNEYSPSGKEYSSVAEINLIHMDASIFIEQIRNQYDVIIIDFPDPNTPELSKLYSKKFYTHLRYRLKPKGLFCQQSSSPFDSKEAFLCIGRTIQETGYAVVPIHDNIPSFGEWGFWIAGKQESYSNISLKEKLKNISLLSVETKYLTPELIKSSTVFGKSWLITKNTDINTIFNHKVFHYYIEGWKKIYE